MPCGGHFGWSNLEDPLPPDLHISHLLRGNPTITPAPSQFWQHQPLHKFERNDVCATSPRAHLLLTKSRTHSTKRIETRRSFPPSASTATLPHCAEAASRSVTRLPSRTADEARESAITRGYFAEDSRELSGDS